MSENITPLPVAFAGIDLDGEVCGFYSSKEQADEYANAGGIEGLYMESQIAALTARVKELEEALRRIELFGHTNGHGHGYTCADWAEAALNKEPT